MAQPQSIPHPDLPVFCFPAEPAERAVAILHHGLGEHATMLSMSECGAALAARGITVYTFDAAGHGRQPGPRGYIASFDEFTNPLVNFSHWVAARHGQRRPFALGMSLGSLITLDAAPRLDTPGVVVAGAPVGPVGVPKPLEWLGNFLARVAPRVSLPTGLDYTNITSDDALRERYLADPVYHRVATAGLFAEFQLAVARVRAAAPALRQPILMLHGEADVIARPDPSYFDALGSADKHWQSYAGLRHNLFVETKRGEVFTRMAEWILARAR